MSFILSVLRCGLKVNIFKVLFWEGGRDVTKNNTLCTLKIMITILDGTPNSILYTMLFILYSMPFILYSMLFILYMYAYFLPLVATAGRLVAVTSPAHCFDYFSLADSTEST